MTSKQLRPVNNQCLDDLLDIWRAEQRRVKELLNVRLQHWKHD
jgi:hypothetical protein